MFHAYCQKMAPEQARAVTIEILKISRAGFDYAMRKDPLEPLRMAKRDQLILDMRCEGYSYAYIAKHVKLSRVQIWRIIEGFQSKLDVIKSLSTSRVHKSRLTVDQLESIKRMKKMGGVAPAQVSVPPMENLFLLFKRHGERTKEHHGCTDVIRVENFFSYSGNALGDCGSFRRMQNQPKTRYDCSNTCMG